MTTRIIMATKQEVGGARRKLAWFSRSSTDLYFEVGGMLYGSHTSYHRDGNIFRTSPVTENRAIMERKSMPLADFSGWHQFGVSMLRKIALPQTPALKPKDTRSPSHVYDLDLQAYPSDTLNFVIELLHPDCETLLDTPELAPPADAGVFVIREVTPWVVLTVLGHDHNLLISPAHEGVTVRHINSRYSANRPGELYKFEAYKDE